MGARAESDAASRNVDSGERAYQSIRQSILMGRVAPGATLSQVRLAHDLGISRTPLREALNRLVSEGLVTSDFNRRVRVSELDLNDFDQIYAARLALEPVGILATIGSLDTDELDAISTDVDGMDVAIAATDIESFRVHHRAFHLGLTAHAGARILRMLADLWDNSERYRLAYLHYDESQPAQAFADRFSTSQVEHRAILQTAVDGDANEATALLVAHLSRTLDGVFHDHAQVPQPRVAPHALELAPVQPVAN